MITTKKLKEENKTHPKTTKQYLSGKELANRWGVSHRTVQRWRLDGVGLPYVKIGDRIVRYSLNSIKAYEKEYRPQFVIDINWGLVW